MALYAVEQQLQPAANRVHSAGRELSDPLGELRFVHGLQPVSYTHLSGFLITRRLMEEWRAAGRIDGESFYARRAFRILPPMLVYLAVVSLLGLGLHWIPMDLGQLAASLFFYRNYLTAPVTQAWYTGHFWSLAVEEHFYLIWPVLLWMAGLRRARWLAPALALAVAVWRVADSRYDWICLLYTSRCV